MASNETYVPPTKSEGDSTMASKAMTEIGTVLSSIDSENLGKTLEDVSGSLSAIKTFMDSMASFPEGDYAIKSEMREIIFQTRLVLTNTFDEMAALRSFRRVAVDSLWCLKKELDFTTMDIETFLEENKLSKYKSKFVDDEEIGFAHELLNEKIIKIDDLESAMKPASFNRLKNKLSEARQVKKFLKDDLENTLDKAGNKCMERSSEVRDELKEASKSMAEVAKKLMKSINDGKRRAEIRKLIFEVVKFGATLLMTGNALGIAFKATKGVAAVAEVLVKKGTLAVAGYMLRGAAKEGIQSAADDLKAIEALQDQIESQTSNWTECTEQTIRYWQMLIQKCTGLVEMLKSDGEAFDKKAISNLKSHIETSKKALDRFDEDIDKLEDVLTKAVMA